MSEGLIAYHDRVVSEKQAAAVKMLEDQWGMDFVLIVGLDSEDRHVRMVSSPAVTREIMREGLEWLLATISEDGPESP